jgi:hypothetical protein
LKTCFHHVWGKNDWGKEDNWGKKDDCGDKADWGDEAVRTKKAGDPFIAGFIESMSKTNTEKITKEILEGLSEDTDDSDSYDAESGDEDSEDRPWRPSHSVFGKSTIKQSHLDNMRGRYFRDMSIVRVGGDNIVPAPEENEVVIYRSFFKASLRFPLSKFVVEVLKIYQIFPSSDHPRSYNEDGDFCLGCKESRAGAEREVLLQHAWAFVRDEGYLQRTVPQQLQLLWIYCSPQCKPPGTNIPEKMAWVLDGGVVLC